MKGSYFGWGQSSADYGITHVVEYRTQRALDNSLALARKTKEFDSFVSHGVHAVGGSFSNFCDEVFARLFDPSTPKKKSRPEHRWAEALHQRLNETEKFLRLQDRCKGSAYLSAIATVGFVKTLAQQLANSGIEADERNEQLQQLRDTLAEMKRELAARQLDQFKKQLQQKLEQQGVDPQQAKQAASNAAKAMQQQMSKGATPQQAAQTISQQGQGQQGQSQPQQGQQGQSQQGQGQPGGQSGSSMSEAMAQLMQQAAAEAENTASNLQQAIQQTIQQGTELRQQVEEFQDEILNAIGSATDKASSEADEKVEEEVKVVQGLDFGLDPGNPGTIDPAIFAKYIDVVGKFPHLKKIIEIAGRLKMISKKVKSGKTVDARHTIDKVDQGKTLSNLIPIELVKMAAAPDLFLEDYQNGQLSHFEMAGKDLAGLGPLIVCVDVSGSTEWSVAIAEKALLAVMLEKAIKQRRPFAVINFDGRVQQVDFFPPAKNKSEKRAAAIKLLDSLSFHSGGGTDFEPPIRRAIEIINEKENKRLRDADIVFMTDGSGHIGDDLIQELNKIKSSSGLSLYSVMICSPGDKEDGLETLTEFSDSVSWLNERNLFSDDSLENAFQEIFKI